MEPHARNARAVQWSRTLGRSLAAGAASIALVGVLLAAVPGHVGGAAAAETGPFVTLLIGRSMWTQSEGGQVVPGQPTLLDVAEALAAQGVRATGVVVPARTLESGILDYNGNLYPSWQELGVLRDQYGWSFVSNGQNRVDITTLPRDEQFAESCGSLAAFESHGHLRAWGMYGPGSNNITDEIATNVVGTCFGFTRLYWGNNLNDRAVVTQPPYYAYTERHERRHLQPCAVHRHRFRREVHAAHRADAGPSGRRDRSMDGAEHLQARHWIEALGWPALGLHRSRPPQALDDRA